jgi:hypothetical protein
MDVSPRTEPKAHSHVYRWPDVKASKEGGPRAVCRLCGESASTTRYQVLNR